MTGSERIAAERQRQIEQEGWTPHHDDQHEGAEIASAAAAYVETARHLEWGHEPQLIFDHVLQTYWPWHRKWFKPSIDPMRNLEKAGALIAAEIDRLQRLAD